jgi:hypothetical protein
VVLVAVGIDSEGIEGLGVALEVESEEGEEKCKVMVAGPDVSSVRVTVMGTAGLWYFRRMRWLRQNCLDKGVNGIFLLSQGGGGSLDAR